MRCRSGTCSTEQGSEPSLSTSAFRWRASRRCRSGTSSPESELLQAGSACAAGGEAASEQVREERTETLSTSGLLGGEASDAGREALGEGEGVALSCEGRF